MLESVLSKQPWLVGGRASAADIAFITLVLIASSIQCDLKRRHCYYRWNHLATTFFLKDFNDFNFEKDFPSVSKYVLSITPADSRMKLQLGT